MNIAISSVVLSFTKEKKKVLCCRYGCKGADSVKWKMIKDLGKIEGKHTIDDLVTLYESKMGLGSSVFY